ncbi:hypothetical protein [Marinicellulosiphila megalodicopiae]|uniref:hypothetical protein n=1 Tax=Marinicellulosiphila megalodicopiae TaxID=2724896 RepID=UPI003BAE94BE
MNILKLSLFSVFLFAAISCQVQENKDTQSKPFNPVYDPAPAANSFESLLHHSGFSQLHLMIQREGEKMLCAQPAYQVCFDVSKEMCEIETKQWVFSCLSDANYKVPTVYDKVTRGQFMGAYGACMINNHAFRRADEIEEVSKCMVNAPLDEELAIKALVEGKRLYQPSGNN